MTGSGATILVSAIAIAGGTLSLRAGWARAQGRLLVGIGWLAILAGLIALAAGDGAWGLSVGVLIAALTASLALAQAALASVAPDKERRVRAATPSVLLRPGGAEGLLRGLGVFILVVPVAFGASALSALAVQAAARSAGWLEADSTAFALFVFPVIWTLLAIILMLRSGPRLMLKPLAGTFAAAGALFLIFVRGA